jgi:DMSO/TMAO reductase YedYZ molybdopterin-dependent catalytic subunit
MAGRCVATGHTGAALALSSRRMSWNTVGRTLAVRQWQKLLTTRPLVREFSLSQLSATFPINGTSMPPGDDYKRLVDSEFSDWKLKVHGLVNRPIALTLAQIQALPSRTQITMHTCDEGWSAIGKGRGGWWEDSDKAVWYAGQ